MADTATTATTATTVSGINDYIVTPQKIAKYEVDATNYVLCSNTTEKLIPYGENTYTKKYEFFIPFAGSLSISFSIHENVYGRIYKNDVAVGLERGHDSGGYRTYTETINNINCGDLIQIYCKRGTYGGAIKDVYIKTKNPLFPIVLL